MAPALLSSTPAERSPLGPPLKDSWHCEKLRLQGHLQSFWMLKGKSALMSVRPPSLRGNANSLRAASPNGGCDHTRQRHGEPLLGSPSGAFHAARASTQSAAYGVPAFIPFGRAIDRPGARCFSDQHPEAQEARLSNRPYFVTIFSPNIFAKYLFQIVTPNSYAK